MRKMKEALSTLSYDELKHLEQDMQTGSHELKKIVLERMQELDNLTKFCAVCFSDIREKEYTYTLLFGQKDFKRKAHFCALDCMEYFMSHVKEMKTQEVQK